MRDTVEKVGFFILGASMLFGFVMAGLGGVVAGLVSGFVPSGLCFVLAHIIGNQEIIIELEKRALEGKSLYSSEEEGTKTCPRCENQVRVSAGNCPHCGRENK